MRIFLKPQDMGGEYRIFASHRYASINNGGHGH